ncbi:DUF1684 domain-containing protein [Cellulomonas chengniuliangii]|uniref:DUF1684 domain-containing protein n=1 Tax=Cellulomonas chengniuliangii TaxID=2968084 RepID=UPI001D0F2E9C|nr:DUF1684 domain-containing protein [Cellulomonas chengniuliangii]MCC2318766.1 DUF1684 domain-containing protein [Cellulomonas chengniuliangii]
MTATTDPATDTDPAVFVAEWEAWHAAREAKCRDPHGWVAITALHWLAQEPATLDGVPGRWSSVDGTVRIEAATADGITLPDGSAVDGAAELTPVEGASGLSVRAGDLLLEVARRTGHDIVRVHDPKAPQLAAFTGIPTFAPDPAWVAQGRIERFDAPQTVTTGAVVDGLEHHHQAIGTVSFTLGGIEQALVVFSDGPGAKVLFRDATSGVTTYPGARTLALGPIAEDGIVNLDFNRAANLPCGLTQFATCPVAPAENTLTVAVEAGEKWGPARADV